MLRFAQLRRAAVSRCGSAVHDQDAATRSCACARSTHSLPAERAHDTFLTASRPTKLPFQMTEENNDSLADAETASSLANVVEESLRKEKARRFRKGDRVKGHVTRITESMALVGLDGGSEGMLDLERLRREDGTLDIAEGDFVEAIVTDVAANGLLLEKALVTESESLEQLAAAQAAGLPVQATVVGHNKGGLELELYGVRGFCPASQIDLHRVDDMTSYVGQTFAFRLQEVSGRKVVLSRRALLEEARAERREKRRAELQPGAILKGIVTRLQPFGAFVDLGEGFEGLVHQTELTRGRLQAPAQVVSPGDEIEVQLLEVTTSPDKSGRPVERFALSRKALEKDPWENATERFPVGARVKGKVVRLQPFGAFIELAEGIDGLAHISTLAPKRIEHPSEVVSVGDEVEAFVLAVEPEKQRLSLSLKDPAAKREPTRPRADDRQPRSDRPERSRRPTRGKPEGGGSTTSPIGSVHDAVIEKVEPFGIFVTLPDGGRALVPNRELSVPPEPGQAATRRKGLSPGDPLRVAITESRRGELKASQLEAERADERAQLREWSKGQKAEGGGKSGFGTLGDLFGNVRLGK